MPKFFIPGDSDDPLYSLHRDQPDFEKRKKIIESAWEKYLPYCGDSPEQFINEAKKNFIGQTWHLFLANYFLVNGFNLLKTDKRGPDLCLEIEGSKFWIEVVGSSKGTGKDRAPDYTNVSGYIPVVDTRIQLRLANSFITKYAKIAQYIDLGIIGPADYCFIGINSFEVDLSFFSPGYSYMFRTLFGLGEEYLETDRTKAMKRIGVKKVGKIQKNSMKYVDVGFFEKPEFKRLDGVFFYPKDPMGIRKNFREGIELTQNPLRMSKIPENVSKCFNSWLYEDDLMKFHALEDKQN